MKSPTHFKEKVREKGLACTLVYTAIGSVMMAREKLESIFERLVEKGETSDAPCARTVRDWLERKESGKIRYFSRR